MDPRDRLRPAFDGVAPTTPGASVPADRIRILDPRDDVTFIGAR